MFNLKKCTQNASWGGGGANLIHNNSIRINKNKEITQNNYRENL